MRKPYQSPGRMKNSSYYIAPVGDRTHDLLHTVASNMVKLSHAPNHLARPLMCYPRKLLCLLLYDLSVDIQVVHVSSG